MPMRITCPNCGKQFSAWDDLVGKSVECPKCHQKTVIAGPNTALQTPPTPAKPASPAKKSPPAPPATSQVPKTPASARPGSVPPPPPKSPSPAPIARAAPPNLAAVRPNPPRSVQPVRPPQDSNLDDDDSLPNGCPNCNATMAPNDDLCDSCGYHLVLKKVIDISDMPKRDQTIGFERLLKDQLHDPESTANTLLWVKITASVFFVIMMFVCLGQWWWVGVLLVAGIGGFIWMKKRQQAGDTDATINRDPVSAIAWTAMLAVQRVLGWRRMQWPFAKTRSLILCDPAFDDSELAALDRLADLETLDLEGTGITDAAIETLRPLKQLRFLVLRRTAVTQAGARKLQQDLPKTLIWI